QLTTARVVEAEDLLLRGCPVIVMDGQVLGGVDGVIPLSLFGGFMIRLDVPGRVLELGPYPAEDAEIDIAFARARAQRNLLFLRTRLADAHEGYLLLDTGSAFNVISNVTASALGQARALAQPLSLVAGPGVAEGRLLPCRV